MPNADRFRTAIAIAIAATSVVGAVLAGTAAHVTSLATDAQSDGFIAVVNVQNTDATSRTSLYQQLRALVDQRHNLAMADALEADAASATDPAAAASLRAQAEEYRAAAQAAETFLSPAYRTADGEVDQDLFLQDQRSFAAKHKDLEPADDYAASTTQRSRALALVASLIGLSTAVLFFTLAEQSRAGWRTAFFVAGLVIAACAVCGTLAVEFGRGWFGGGL